MRQSMQSEMIAIEKTHSLPGDRSSV